MFLEQITGLNFSNLGLLKGNQTKADSGSWENELHSMKFIVVQLRVAMKTIADSMSGHLGNGFLIKRENVNLIELIIF